VKAGKKGAFREDGVQGKGEGAQRGILSVQKALVGQEAFQNRKGGKRDSSRQIRSTGS